MLLYVITRKIVFKEHKCKKIRYFICIQASEKLKTIPGFYVRKSLVKA